MSRRVSRNDYNFGARLLHRFALAWPGIARASFDFERSLAKAEQPAEKRHVFVAGLARAGTTVLLRALYQTGVFRSLTYRDMPFVLMPGMWRRLSRHGRKQGEFRERAHGDGIDVSFDSPEAFEEVFWRVFCGSEYLRPDHLRTHRVSSEIIDVFRQYVAQVLASAEEPTQTRYLSKNNNNVLRMPSLAEAFPQALVVIPFRNPLQQADSLLIQHRRFVARHNEDRFGSAYMRWLGHHEFGVNHRPFRFSETSELASIKADSDSPEYWLKIWLETYTHILHNRPTRSLLVCYEDLCNNPDAHLRRIHTEVDLPYSCNDTGVEFAEARRNVVSNVEAGLKDRALSLYGALRTQSDF